MNILLIFIQNNKFNANINFNLSLVTPDVVEKIILNLKTNASGHDGITKQMIKLCIPFMTKHITHVVNCCLESGYFPKSCKYAMVCPILKVTNPTKFGDLRPISLLPVLSKKFEIYNSYNTIQ